MMSLHQRKNHLYSLLFIIFASIGGSTLCLGINSFNELDPCLLQSVYSYLHEPSNPPTTIDGLRASCKYQQDGFKCLKEKIKSTPSLVKRGINSFLQTRQRFSRKYCTNVNSDNSRRHVSDMKCIMEKKLASYKELDRNFVSTLHEIRRRNYNDSAIELKYICCTLVGYRKHVIENVGPECLGSKSGVEEMITSIVSNDINLICDDEEKLTLKVCPTLEPYKLPPKGGLVSEEKIGPSALVLYLIMTLGEPDKTLI